MEDDSNRNKNKIWNCKINFKSGSTSLSPDRSQMNKIETKIYLISLKQKKTWGVLDLF